MDLQTILFNPIVQTIITEISDRCPEEAPNNDNYRWLAEKIDGLNVAYGETKAVLIYRDWDFVIKIPRYCRYDTDYCELEVNKYQSAKDFGVEKILLETRYFATAGTIDLYIQPRFSCSHADFNGYNKLNKKLHHLQKRPIVRRINETMYDYTDETWIARALQLYGKKFFLQFEKWTNQERVGDLHNNNIGWLKGRPIILDYSGYYG